MTVIPARLRSRRVKGMGPLTWQSRLAMTSAALGAVYVVLDWCRVLGLF